MFKSLKILATAGLLAATAFAANAAPSNMSPVTDGLSNGVVKVQRYDDDRRGRRFDRSCRRGPGGWYRYNRFGERRPCRTWRGEGRRPDACVKFGPIFYCDY